MAFFQSHRGDKKGKSILEKSSEVDQIYHQNFQSYQSFITN